MTMKRNTYIDLWKYICSLLVIGIHTKLAIDINEWLWVLVQSIARIAVPIFLCFSGCFFYQKISNGGSRKKIYIAEAKRYMIAYAIATTPYLILGFINKSTSVSNVSILARSLIWSGVSTHLWYFPALLLSLSISVILTFYINKARTYKMLAILLYLVCSFADIYAKIFHLNSLSENILYTEFIRHAFYSLSFFLFGISLCISRQTGYRANTGKIAILAILLITEQAITHAAGINNSFTFAVMNIVFVPEMALAIMNRTDYAFDKYKFGKASTFIYFYHPIIISLSTRFTDSTVLQWIIPVITLSAICFLLGKTENKFYCKLF